jgi:hypothetical protein
MNGGGGGCRGVRSKNVGVHTLFIYGAPLAVAHTSLPPAAAKVREKEIIVLHYFVCYPPLEWMEQWVTHNCGCKFKLPLHELQTEGSAESGVT